MAPIDSQLFLDKAKRDLLQLLDTVLGKKNLVLERKLVGPLELVVNFPTLQEHGTDRIFFLENDNVDSSQKNIVFVASGETATNALKIASQIKRIQQSSATSHEFHIFWVPRRTLHSDTLLEEAGVLGDATVSEWNLLFKPLAPDLLSLELEDAFGDLYLRKDPTCILLSAKALMTIQQRHGLFPRILGKGDNAKRLADMLVRMRTEIAADSKPVVDGLLPRQLIPSSSIENLVIVDRDADFATSLMTQLTYAGLLDEFFGIRHNQLEAPTSIVGAPQPQGSQSTPKEVSQSTQSKRKIKVDNSDKLYEQLRDANFAVVGGLLNKVARRLLQTEQEGRQDKKSTAELRELVGKLRGFQAEKQSLDVHTALAEEVMKQTQTETFSRVLEIQQNLIAGTDPSTLHDRLEDLIARGCPLPTVLRLVCLESCVAGGLKARDFDAIRRQIVQAYGYEHTLTLHALEKMQLLVPRPAAGSSNYFPGAALVAGPTQSADGTAPGAKSTNYSPLRRQLHLIRDEVSEQNPDDVAYVFSGYAPLSVRIAQCVLQKSHLAALSTSSGGSKTGTQPSGTANTASTTAGKGTTAPQQAPAAAAADASQGWRGFESPLQYVKGATFDLSQVDMADKALRARQVLAGGSAGGSTGSETRTSVVFFLGGISHAEIAALRFVANQLDEEAVAQGRGRRKLLICTTSVISGEAVVRAAMAEAERATGATAAESR